MTTVVPWTRATSRTVNGSRAMGSFPRVPACGPVPVTSVPVARTTTAKTGQRPVRRRTDGGWPVDRVGCDRPPGGGELRLEHQHHREGEVTEHQPWVEVAEDHDAA
ncbi:MAG: hypothetical protein CM1200mP26_17400 [Acidimicrobiales bacterium]|nr:MAG: hypothetical protein CM1200mP26_17400 [Acidimicrobiales bacterium]